MLTANDINRIKLLALHTRRELWKTIVHPNSNEFYKDFGCACAVSSATLHRVLRAHGYKPQFVVGMFEGDNHAYLVVDDHIIDITATQFNVRQRCHITHIKDNRYIAEFTSTSAFNRLRGWPREQQPNTWRGDIKNIVKRVIARTQKVIF